MANINLKYPDGRLEEKELLTAINKDGLNIAVINLNNSVNGNKVTGVMLLSDGYYQNIVDDAVWKNITKMLIDSIHGSLLDSDYQKLEGEVNVTADPYRQLALRDGNYDSLVQNYSNAMAKLVTVTQVGLENKDNTPLESSEEALPDTGIQEEQPVAPIAPDYGKVEDITPSFDPLTSPDQDVQETSESKPESLKQVDMNNDVTSMSQQEGIIDVNNSYNETVAGPAPEAVPTTPIVDESVQSDVQIPSVLDNNMTPDVANMAVDTPVSLEPAPEVVPTTPIVEEPVQSDVQIPSVPENNLTPDVANMAVDTPVSLEPAPEAVPTTPIVEEPVQSDVQIPSVPENNMTSDVANMGVDTPVSLEPAPEVVPTTPIVEEPVQGNVLQFPENPVNNQDNDIVAAIDQVYEEARNEINTILDRTKAKTFEILKNGLNNTKNENIQNTSVLEDGPVLELNKAA